MTLLTKRTFSLPAPNRREILRYAGVRTDETGYDGILDEIAAEALPLLVPQVVYGRWSLTPLSEKELILGPLNVTSAALGKNLAGCTEAVLFAATLGPSLDRYVARTMPLSPAKALFADALGTERIEALCDALEETLVQENGLCLRPRFSPGYGDLPISLQRDLFILLDCPRKIGLTLNESMLMTPQKSVTAIIGLTDGDKSPRK